MSIDTLRRLVAKHYGCPCVVSDYDMHSVVVTACRSRQPLIELVQKELDRCHHLQVKQFQLAKTDVEVAILWRSAAAGGDVKGGLAGALWASLTHPRTDELLRAQITQDIHMIQHSVGDQSRRDAEALARAQKINAELLGELDVARARLLKVQTQSAQEIQTLQQQLADAAAAQVGTTSHNTALKHQIDMLRQSVDELDSREKLSLRIDLLSEQNSRLKQQLADTTAKKFSLVESADMAPGAVQVDTQTQTRVINLQRKNVLCVGGRSGAVASYRLAVERAGGRFVHHDGGIEHNHHRLDANLAAADCVVCQTACISHTAYWLVKDYCKKTGKACVSLTSRVSQPLLRDCAHYPLVTLCNPSVSAMTPSASQDTQRAAQAHEHQRLQSTTG